MGSKINLDMSYNELPDLCYIYLDVDNCIGLVKKGEQGYYPINDVDCSDKSEDEVRALVNKLNSKLDVTEEQSEVMKIKSMFGGWPTAKTEGLENVKISDERKQEILNEIIDWLDYHNLEDRAEEVKSLNTNLEDAIYKGIDYIYDHTFTPEDTFIAFYNIIGMTYEEMLYFGIYDYISEDGNQKLLDMIEAIK